LANQPNGVGLMYKPDYNKLRDEAGFNWRVESNYYSLMDFINIPLKELYKSPKAMIELFRKGTGPLKDIFGDDVREPCLSTPAISYGHVNCLGAELLFPDDPAGEVIGDYVSVSGKNKFWSNWIK
jgi:hypothetical protein